MLMIFIDLFISILIDMCLASHFKTPIEKEKLGFSFNSLLANTCFALKPIKSYYKSGMLEGKPEIMNSFIMY